MPLDPSPRLGETSNSAGTLDDLAEVFDRVSALMYDISGVKLTEGKKELVRARLSKRIRALGGSSYRDYVELVESSEGRSELVHMVDILTTNKTSFFRELPHFAFLRDEILPAFKESRRPLRIWSAGCSSGEEPYSLAILLHQVFPDIQKRNFKILATDLSRQILQKAMAGIYDENQMEGVSPKIRGRFFTAAKDGGTGSTRYQVKPELRSLVTLAPLNLMKSWPMSGPFDVIMCRNVMIYFDRTTRERLVQRFGGLLPPGGHLMVGHSESLNGLNHGLHYVQPAVYRK